MPIWFFKFPQNIFSIYFVKEHIQMCDFCRFRLIIFSIILYEFLGDLFRNDEKGALFANKIF